MECAHPKYLDSVINLKVVTIIMFILHVSNLSIVQGLINENNMEIAMESVHPEDIDKQFKSVKSM